MWLNYDLENDFGVSKVTWIVALGVRPSLHNFIKYSSVIVLLVSHTTHMRKTCRKNLTFFYVSVNYWIPVFRLKSSWMCRCKYLKELVSNHIFNPQKNVRQKEIQLALRHRYRRTKIHRGWKEPEFLMWVHSSIIESVWCYHQSITRTTKVQTFDG